MNILGATAQIGGLLGSTIHFFFIALDIFIVVCVGLCKNWARRLYIIFFALSLFGFPSLVLGSFGRIVEISNSVETLLPRLSGIGLYIFNIIFISFLFRPKVRALFCTSPPKTYQRVLLILLAIGSLLAGCITAFGLGQHKGHYRLEGHKFILTDEGIRAQVKELEKGEKAEERSLAESMLEMTLPPRIVVLGTARHEDFDGIFAVDKRTFHFFNIFLARHDRLNDLHWMLLQLDRHISKRLEKATLGFFHFGMFSPNVLGKKVFRVQGHDVEADYALFNMGISKIEGVVADVLVGNREAKILAYPGPGRVFDAAGVEEFFDVLSVSPPPVDKSIENLRDIQGQLNLAMIRTDQYLSELREKYGADADKIDLEELEKPVNLADLTAWEFRLSGVLRKCEMSRGVDREGDCDTQIESFLKDYNDWIDREGKDYGLEPVSSATEEMPK